jgi:folate-dependent phosphoribosylglycinamide formyltransferase PurN
MNMRVVLLTRTDRPSGAAVAAEILRSSHTLCAVIAEKRTRMLTRKKGLPQVVIRALRNQGAGFVFEKALEYLRIKFEYLLRACKCKHAGQPYCSIGELLLDHPVPYHEVADHNGSETVRILQGIKPDVVVLANTRIIRPDIIRIPARACINLHLGKLPEYRGTASAFWEIFNGEPYGGVTVHFVDEKLDNGDILLEDTVDILAGDTEKSLYAKKLQRGTVLVRNALDLLAGGTYARTRQDPSLARMYRFPTRGERASLKRVRSRDGRKEHDG